MRYPGSIDAALHDWLAGQGSMRAGTTAMQDRYAKGGSSAAIDLAAYVTARLPATYAVALKVLNEVRALMPGFAPGSMLDLGAGPGTASWAACATWDSIAAVQQVEAEPRFQALAARINGAGGIAALAGAEVTAGDLRDAVLPRAELAIAAYVLAELEEKEAAGLARKLWAAAGTALVLIEPGTPAGFARIRAARAALVADRAHIIGPCTHDVACPMTGQDWCHFKERVQRSRAHMHAKGGTVPFEDEPYSWIAMARAPVARPGLRIVSPVSATKIAAEMRVCGAGGLSVLRVAARDKAAYKAAKKRAWGDGIEES